MNCTLIFLYSAVCGAGTYGANCSQTCGQCSNRDFWGNKPQCDVYSGLCVNNCLPGFFPPHCTDSKYEYLEFYCPCILNFLIRVNLQTVQAYKEIPINRQQQRLPYLVLFSARFKQIALRNCFVYLFLNKMVPVHCKGYSEREFYFGTTLCLWQFSMC